MMSNPRNCPKKNARTVSKLNSDNIIKRVMVAVSQVSRAVINYVNGGSRWSGFQLRWTSECITHMQIKLTSSSLLPQLTGGTSACGCKGRGGCPPPIGLYFFRKSRLFRVKGIYLLCAFAINEDGADKLSSAPFSKFLDPPQEANVSEGSGGLQITWKHATLCTHILQLWQSSLWYNRRTSVRHMMSLLSPPSP